MDPNAVVLVISSDEEGGWDDQADKSIFDGNDDYNWIADILDEVNRDDCGRDDGGDDSDEVVLVSEILPRKPRKIVTSKSCSLNDFDDDCVVLDHDPDKPLKVPNDNRLDREEDNDSDDIVVVSENGQVACRDYPHPRHLCIKFPFSSSPNQSHCEQCYCYVCDSLAPCIYWGNGNGSIDHCLATDKIDFWKSERQNSKNVGKDVSVPPINPVHVPVPVSLSMPQNQTARIPVTSSFVVPNIVNQNRSQILQPSNKYQPGLVAQQLTRTSSCTVPGNRVNHGYNLGVHRPAFKRTVSDVFGPTTNRYSYSSYNHDNYINYLTGSSQPNAVNTSVPFSSRSIVPFEFPPNFQPVTNPEPFVEVPVLFKPNPVPLSSQTQVSNYTVSSEASRQESQRSTVDPKFFNGVNWPQSQVNHQPGAKSSLLEGVGSTNEPSLASGSGGLADYELDNWMFNNQPCEPGSTDGSGPFGLSYISPDHGYMDSGTIFEY